MSANARQASIEPVPANATETTSDRLHNSAWFPRDIPIAPDGTLQITLPPPPSGHSLSDNNNINDSVTNKSHETLGGIILGPGHRHLAQSLDRVAPLGFNGRTTNPKSSKYVGVTFRPNRAKFQARIYKGNKEFNLGLFDLSADAALAYDITHRLLAEVEKIAHKELAGKKVEDLPDKVGKGLPLPLSSVLSSEASRTKRIRTEISKLNELEKNPTLTSPALNWLERNSLDCDAPEVLPAKECERLNFRHPREFYDARQTEAEEKKWSPSENVKKVLSTKTKDKKSIVSCQGMYPLIADLKALIRKEAVRVAKAVILHGRGAPVEGDEAGKKKRRKAEERDPLHRKKRRSNKKKSQDIASVANSPPKDEPTSFSDVPSLPALGDTPNGNLIQTDTPAISPRECKNDEYYDANKETSNRVLNAKETNLMTSYRMSSLAKDDTACPSSQIDSSNVISNGKVGRPVLPEMNLNDMPPMMNGIGMSGMGIGGINAMTMTGGGLNGMNSAVTNGMGMTGMGSVGMSGMHEIGMDGLHSIGMNGMMNGINVMGMNGVGMNNMATLGMHGLNGVGITGMNAVAMHNANSMGTNSANSLGMNSMDQIMMAQSRTQNVRCPTAGEMNDFSPANFAYNGMDTSQNINSILNFQRNMNSYPLIASDFMNAAMDTSWLGMSSLSGVVPGSGSKMLSNPYGHRVGNFNMNVNGNCSGEDTMMSNGATTLLPAHSMMMMGAAGGVDAQYGNSLAGMNYQMMLMQQRQQQLSQQGQDGINTHLNDFELNTMGDMAGGVSLLNKSSMVDLGIENIHNKFSGSLNPYQSNFYAGPFSGVNFYPTGNTIDQPVSGDVGSLMGSSPKFCSNTDANKSCDE